MVVDPMDLDVCDAETMPLAALLYQGGYLTIKDADGEDGSISLGIPNVEISKSLHEAAAQARTKDYAGPWLDGAPPVFLVGVNYDPEKHGIDAPLVERA